MVNPHIPQHSMKHHSSLPSARKIRRACQNELYRTIKRLKIWIPEDLVKQGETLYVQKVVGNLIWIHEHSSNRRKLADWWDEAVSEELSLLWKVDRQLLCTAFREAFGG